MTAFTWPPSARRAGPTYSIEAAQGASHVIDPTLIGFADLRGNKQYVSLGNLHHDSRVALFFMDYPNQARLKILGRVEIHEHDPEAPTLIESLRTTDPSAVAERAVLIHVEAFDWNCQQHITPRYTVEELQEALAPLHQRLAKLEAENAALQNKLSLQPASCT